MVKEVHCQLEKFAKYSLNKYSRLRVCKKYTNHQSQLKEFPTNELQYSLVSSYNSTDRTSQPKVGG